MAKSVWPHDTLIDPYRPPRSHGVLRCFVISPFKPEERFDDIYSIVGSICADLKQSLVLERFDCVRADRVTSSGIIQPEVWEEIKHSDIIVADVTGSNGNVMLELGVAAGWRKKEHVIIIRDSEAQEPHLFDINPARHIEYSRTSSGFKKLRNDLATAMFDALADAPFIDVPSEHVPLPLKANFESGKDCRFLWVPPIAHRRVSEDHLEFGSLFTFAHSWLAVGNLQLSNVRVRATMRFLERRETKAPCWMGIMLRSQMFWANYGHLVLLDSKGLVRRTARDDERAQSHRNVDLTVFSEPDLDSHVRFDVSFDTKGWAIEVADFKTFVPVAEMGHVFSTGRILLQTYFCRVALKEIEVMEL